MAPLECRELAEIAQASDVEQAFYVTFYSLIFGEIGSLVTSTRERLREADFEDAVLVYDFTVCYRCAGILSRKG